MENFYKPFVDYFEKLAELVGNIATEKGWGGNWNDGEKIALMHSELSECLEALRHGNPPSEHIPEFSGVEEELADTIIRIMHFAVKNKLEVGKAILAKIAFNQTRPYKHGGKKF